MASYDVASTLHQSLSLNVMASYNVASTLHQSSSLSVTASYDVASTLHQSLIGGTSFEHHLMEFGAATGGGTRDEGNVPGVCTEAGG
jgi:hypothetical protein